MTKASSDEHALLRHDKGQADYTHLGATASSASAAIYNDSPATRRRSMWRDSGNVLMWARVITSITSVADGYGLSVIAGAAVLAKDELDFGTAELGWLLGAAHLSGALAAPLAATVGDQWGRRPAFIIIYLGIICGSIMMSFAQTFPMLLAGRIVEGMSLGAGIGTVMTYMSEVAPSEHRGSFNSSEGLFLITGIMLGYVSNQVLLEVEYNWRLMLGLGATLPLLGLPLLLMGLVPESPRFILVTQGTSRKSALVALVGEKEAARTIAAASGGSVRHREMATWNDILSPDVPTYGKRLLLATGVLVLQSLSGFPFVSVATTGLLTHDVGHAQATQMVLGMGVLQVICCALGSLLVEHAGRRPLLLCSSAGCVASSMAVAAAYHHGLPVVPWKLAGLCCFTVSYQLGLGPVCFCYVSEILPNHMRSKGVGIAMLASRLYGGSAVSGFVVIAETYSPAVPFMINGVLSLVGFVFIYFCVPETRGVMLEHMHRLFDGHVNFESGDDSLNEGAADDASGVAFSDISEPEK